mmetsp:Transcript_40021/g.85477  ORF Transcript_40021/g.85477 Transcript_40021/m.85477 type:complete len:299 (-) Transcript_40021:283-1179(-)
MKTFTSPLLTFGLLATCLLSAHMAPCAAATRALQEEKNMLTITGAPATHGVFSVTDDANTGVNGAQAEASGGLLTSEGKAAGAGIVMSEVTGEQTVNNMAFGVGSGDAVTTTILRSASNGMGAGQAVAGSGDPADAKAKGKASGMTGIGKFGPFKCTTLIPVEAVSKFICGGASASAEPEVAQFKVAPQVPLTPIPITIVPAYAAGAVGAKTAFGGDDDDDAESAAALGAGGAVGAVVLGSAGAGVGGSVGAVDYEDDGNTDNFMAAGGAGGGVTSSLIGSASGAISVSGTCQGPLCR